MGQPLRSVIALAVAAAASLPLAPGGAAERGSVAAIKVGKNVHVSHTRADAGHLEVVLAAHPTDARRLLACSMFGSAPSRSVKSGAYLSFDGGANWEAGAAATDYFAGDPTCVYGPDGTAYYAHKTNTGYNAQNAYMSDTDFLSLHRSRDGGQTWDAAIQGPQTNDRPWIAADVSQGARRGWLYVTYEQHVHGERDTHDKTEFRHAVALQASRNQGASFGDRTLKALMDQSESTGSNAGMSALAVLSDGTVVVLYKHALQAESQRSTSKPRELSASLNVLRSEDGARSFGPAVKVADIVSGYNAPHTKGVTGAMAAAPGGPFLDRLHVVWAEFRSGRGEIVGAHSSDKGLHWSAPVRVSDDPGPPRPGGGPDHFMATVAVNKDGVVGALWYDRRENPDNQGYHVRFAASLDGGASWTPSVRVSEAPNAPEQARGPREAFSLTGGDTAGLAADAAGRFHALWIDNRTGVQQVWTAPVTVEGTAARP